MVESLRFPAEFDIALAQEALGLAVAVDPAARPDVYSEKWAILERALGIRTAVFDATMALAAEHDMAVTDEMISGWPDEGTLAHIRQLTARERKKVGMLDGIDSFVAEQEAMQHVGGTELRWNQNDAMHNTQRFLHNIPPSSWQTSGKSGLINSATGTGKTGIFSKLTAVLKYGENPAEPVRVLIITPRQVLLDQTKNAFAKFAPGIVPGRYYQDIKELHDVTVMSQASFDALVARGELPDYDAIIVDEAHKVGPVTDANLRAYCVDKILLGVTATPNARARALFEHEVHRHDLRDAIQDGILAPVRGQNILAEPDWEALKHQLPTDSAELKRARHELRMEKWKLDALDKIDAAVARGVGVVIRCPAGDDIKFAKDYALMLRKRGLNAVAIGGQQHEIQDGPVKRTVQGAQLKRLQQVALQQFESGGVEVLLYVNALDIGWDSLRAKMFIDMDPTRSDSEIIQAVGRVLRLWEDEDQNPVKAEVYSYVNPDFSGQYTVCDALNLVSGESIEHAPVEVRARPDPADSDAEDRKSQGTVVQGTVFDLDLLGQGEVLQQVDLDHGSREEDAEEEPVEEILDFDEAYLRSGLGALAFHGLWRGVGYERTDHVSSSELLELLSLYWETNPAFRPEPLPEGFVPESEVLPLLDRHDLKQTGVRHLASRHGYPAQRFISSGRVGFYYAEADVAIIAELLNRRHHR